MPKEKGIRVSKEHGLNPTLGICFWCRKPTNEIGLAGYIKGDKEAPKYSILSYEPCDECKKNFALGVLVMEATTQPNTEKQPPIQKANEKIGTPDLYPTGRYVVMKREAATRIFNVPEDQIKDKVFVDKEVMDLILPAKEEEQNEGENVDN